MIQTEEDALRRRLIEELAVIMCTDKLGCKKCVEGRDGYLCAYKIVARIAIEAGYRKVSERSVVLTWAEYQKYCAYKKIEPQIRGCLDRENALQKQVEELGRANIDLWTANQCGVKLSKNPYSAEVANTNK